MKLTIVTVVWNAAENIKNTLDSIRRQTCKDLEYVVIDGESTDGTLEILQANKDIIDTFLSEKDAGLYDAMNKGKNLATGDFVLFMNAGDIFLADDVLERMAKQMTEKEALYHGNTIVYFDAKRYIAPPIHHQSLFYPKSFYKKEDYNVKKYKVVAESDYTHRAVDRYPQIHLDINMILSRIEGFRVLRYSTIGGTKMIFNEVQAVMKEHGKHVTLKRKIMYPIKCMMKFVGFKIGGLPFVAKMIMSQYKEVKE